MPALKPDAFSFQVWVWIAGCRADGSTGSTLPESRSTEGVH